VPAGLLRRPYRAIHCHGVGSGSLHGWRVVKPERHVNNGLLNSSFPTSQKTIRVYHQDLTISAV
jgi:hypothetical protein